MDEVDFIVSIIEDNWTKAVNTVGSTSVNAYGDTPPQVSDTHKATPTFIDVRSITPGQGRRFDADTDVVIVYEDSALIEHPTLDWTVRNETYDFTVHIRTMQPKGQAELTFSRDRLQSLYQIVRYILEKEGLRPSIGNYNADIIQITGRNEANDRGKRLLGYKLSVTMKRFGRPIVS